MISMDNPSVDLFLNIIALEGPYDIAFSSHIHTMNLWSSYEWDWWVLPEKYEAAVLTEL